jgi:hypothetical protein
METDPSKPPNPPLITVIGAITYVPDINNTIHVTATSRLKPSFY